MHNFNHLRNFLFNSAKRFKSLTKEFSRTDSYWSHLYTHAGFRIWVVGMGSYICCSMGAAGHSPLSPKKPGAAGHRHPHPPAQHQAPCTFLQCHSWGTAPLPTLHPHTANRLAYKHLQHFCAQPAEKQFSSLSFQSSCCMKSATGEEGECIYAAEMAKLKGSPKLGFWKSVNTESTHNYLILTVKANTFKQCFKLLSQLSKEL